MTGLIIGSPIVLRTQIKINWQAVFRIVIGAAFLWLGYWLVIGKLHVYESIDIGRTGPILFISV
jgi:hypothetical protein